MSRFVLERFPPLAYGPLLLAFVSCGAIGVARAAGVAPGPEWRHAAVLTGVALVFFRLRLADELKDAVLDRRGRPERPLPRGLVEAAELKLAWLACVLLEAMIAATLGAPALIAYGAVLAFTLLAARDFLLPALAQNPLVYAAAHSPVVALLFGLVWWAEPGARWSPVLVALAALASAAAFALEIGRKTLASYEERPFVPTYSAALGQPMAVAIAATALLAGLGAGAAYGIQVGKTSNVFAMGCVAGACGLLVALRAADHPRAWRGFVSASALVLLGLPAAIELVGILTPW